MTEWETKLTDWWQAFGVMTAEMFAKTFFLKMLFAIWVTCPFDPGMITCDHSLDKLLSCCILLSSSPGCHCCSSCHTASWMSWCETDMTVSSDIPFQTNNEWLLWANKTGLLQVHKFHWELMFPDAAVTASLVGIQISKTLTFQYISILERHLRSSIGLSGFEVLWRQNTSLWSKIAGCLHILTLFDLNPQRH